MNAYIKLKDSSDNEYRFRVVFEDTGYRPVRNRNANIQQTVTGKIDRQYGPVALEWHYALIVAATTDPGGSDYGVLSNLKDLYDEEDALTLTDHYEAEHTVYMEGPLVEEPYGPKLSGSGIWFKAPIHLVKSEAES